MRFIQALSTVLLTTQLLLLEDITCKIGKQKPTKLTRKFLESPFDLCGESRLLNPVEAVKAHALATKLVVHCVKDVIVHYAPKIHLPAEAIYPLSKITCWVIHVVYAFFSESRGTHIVNKRQEFDPMWSVVRSLLHGARVRGELFVVPLGGRKSFKMDWVIFEKSLLEMAVCVFHSVDGGPPLDGDYIVHTVKHVRVLLL